MVIHNQNKEKKPTIIPFKNRIHQLSKCFIVEINLFWTKYNVKYEIKQSTN